MTKLEAIVRQASVLSADERAQLIAILAEQTARDAEADEVAVGQRGLAGWTESTRDEDWSEFYPAALKTNRGGLK